MKRFTKAPLQKRISIERSLVGSHLRIASGWVDLGMEDKRRRSLLDAAEASRELAALLERAAAEPPKQQWTMSVGGGR